VNILTCKIVKTTSKKVHVCLYRACFSLCILQPDLFTVVLPSDDPNMASSTESPSALPINAADPFNSTHTSGLRELNAFGMSRCSWEFEVNESEIVCMRNTEKHIKCGFHIQCSIHYYYTLQKQIFTLPKEK